MKTASPQPGLAARPRLDSLTGLRWWAAFGVFMFHMLNFAPVPGISTLVLFGNSGVAFFFVLSGFVLTYSARPTTTTRNFYWRRFARIYPAHIVALLLAVPVFYSFAEVEEGSWVKPFSLGILLLSVVLLQGWSNNPEILFSGNPAAWTLTVEAFFYMLHPWVNKLLQPLRRRGTILLIIAAWGAVVGYQIVINVVPGTVLAQAPMPLRRLGEFVIGMGLAQLAILGWRLKVPPIVGYGLLAAFTAVLVVGIRFNVEHSLFQWALRLYEPIFILLFALIIFAVATRDAQGGRSLLRSPVLVRLGEWSFAFYLVHATVIYAFRHLFDKQPMAFSNLMWYLPVFLVALLFAWLLYRLVEHPVEGRMRKWGNVHLM